MCNEHLENEHLENEHLEMEADGWVTFRIATAAQHAPTRTSAATALAHDEIPPPFRWALHHDQVVLQGDLRRTPGDSAAAVAERLRQLAGARSYCATDSIDRRDFACALGELPLERNTEDGRWHTVFAHPTGSRHELTAELTPWGVQTTCVVATWEHDLHPDCRAALLQFLTHANGRLRFARVVLADGQVRAESTARGDCIEAELPDSLRGVAAAAGALQAEIQLLLLPEAAAAYLAGRNGLPAQDEIL